MMLVPLFKMAGVFVSLDLRVKTICQQETSYRGGGKAYNGWAIWVPWSGELMAKVADPKGWIADYFIHKGFGHCLDGAWAIGKIPPNCRTSCIEEAMSVFCSVECQLNYCARHTWLFDMRNVSLLSRILDFCFSMCLLGHFPTAPFIYHKLCSSAEACRRQQWRVSTTQMTHGQGRRHQHEIRRKRCIAAQHKYSFVMFLQAFSLGENLENWLNELVMNWCRKACWLVVCPHVYSHPIFDSAWRGIARQRCPAQFHDVLGAGCRMS